MEKYTSETRLALVEQNVFEIKQQMSDIRGDTKSLSGQIEQVLNAKLGDHIELKSEIREMQRAIIQLQRQSNMWRWLSPTFSSLLTAVTTFLIIFYVQHLH